MRLTQQVDGDQHDVQRRHHRRARRQRDLDGQHAEQEQSHVGDGALAVFAAALLGVICAQAEDALPPRFTYDRYSKMVDNSPFAIATAVAAPAATPDFAKDLYVANAARSPDGDLVTIASTSDHNFKKYLTTKGSVDGYSIADIEWSERVGATKDEWVDYWLGVSSEAS